MKPIVDIFTAIAREHLCIETLEKRKSDSLDFHNVSVWGVERALSAAYQAGVNASAQSGGDAGVLREMREALERAEFLMRRVYEGDHHALENLPSAATQARAALAKAMAAPSPVAELLAALKGVLGESDYDAEGCCRGCGREREDEAYKYCAIDDDVEDCPFGFARAVIAKETAA